MYKAIIIDDERLAREELKSLLQAYNEIEIVAECSSADNGISEINEKKPDLIFLDIQMPEKDGFQLLEELDYVPEVIFVSAYDEYALKAFEVNALDYVLKPVVESRLDEAIKKVIGKLNSEKNESGKKNENGLLSEKDQVFIKDGEKCWFVNLPDIRIFESEGNYVRVFFGTNKPLILKSLNNLEKKLDNKLFFRANRKFIINLRNIESVENWFNGGLMVKLKSGEQIEISRRQAAKFKDMMSL
jgi:two-component system, LytTR family, response regulator